MSSTELEAALGLFASDYPVLRVMCELAANCPTANSIAQE
jgi:hypothetical protein